MWLSRRMKESVPVMDADLGVTTIAGKTMGVMSKGEVRSLPVYGPGGYAWMPEADSGVLVIKGGPGGEEQCVAGVEQKIQNGMQAGEVCITTSGGNMIYLKRNGEIELRGKISIQGELAVNGEAYRPCSCVQEVL